MNRALALPMVLAVAQWGQCVHAQGDVAAGARTAATAQVVEQKLAMVDRMLNQSPVAARVMTSENEKARRHITNARELMQHARTLTTGGQFRGADSLLNEAIWEISRAQQLVPDPGTLQASERARYSQLEDSIAALLRTTAISGAQSAPEAGGSAAARSTSLIQQAAVLARANRYAEANRQLDEALLLLLKDASSRLAGKTLVYDKRFASRREEFDYEVARHRSFERLVPLALLEFRPTGEAQALVDRYVGQARDLRERGEALAARDATAAIRHVTDGTDLLRRALQAAGLAVPQLQGTE